MIDSPASKSLLQPQLPADATVKIIGLGGVGGIVARYAMIFLAARRVPARLCLVDGDAFEPANAQRMYFLRYGNKAAMLRDELRERYAQSGVTILAIEEFVNPQNISRLLRSGPGEIVLLCVDNHATRKLVNDHSAGLADCCLISGGNDPAGPDSSGRVRRGTYGNCQIYVRRGGRDCTPSLSQYHPEIDQPGDRIPTAESCVEAVASTPQILFANLMVASAMLNTFYLHACSALPYAEVCFDLADGLMQPLPLPLPGPA